MWQRQLRMLSSEHGGCNHLLSPTAGTSITTSHRNSVGSSPDSFPPTSQRSALASGASPPWLTAVFGLDWELPGNTAGVVSFISVQWQTLSGHSVNVDDQRYELVGWGPPRGQCESLRPCSLPLPLHSALPESQTPSEFCCTFPYSDLSLQDSALVTPLQAPGEVLTS